MEMGSYLKDVCRKYSFSSLSEKVDFIENEQFVAKIGFLGEFSSGKSTLINALIGRKLLPAMAQPTSKSIVEIVPNDNLDKPLYWLNSKDGSDSQKLSALEFSQYATENNSERLKLTLEIPVTETSLDKDFIFVDTPGVSSLDKEDEDLTFGYLPELDGVVICTDINQGSLTQSIIEFLAKKEVKIILNNFLFAITLGDTKKDRSDAVRLEVIKQLKTFCEAENVKIDDLEHRVFVVAAKPALDDKDKAGLNEFEAAFKSKIYQNKKLLQQERRDKELLKIGFDILTALSDLKENLSLNDEELSVKDNELKVEIARIEKEMEKSQRDFVEFENRVRREFRNIAEQYAGQVSMKGGNDQIQAFTTALAQDLSEAATRNTQVFFGENFLQNFNLNLNCGSFATDMQTVVSTIDIGKTVLTAVATAWILPGAGLAANAGEAAYGATGREISSNIAKRGAVQLAEKATVKAVLLKGVCEVAKVLDQINPIEHLGNFLGQKYISNKSFEEFGAAAERAASDLCFNLQYELDQQLFEPLQDKLQQLRENIKNSRQEREKSRQDSQKQKQQMILDEADLQKILTDRRN